MIKQDFKMIASKNKALLMRSVGVKKENDEYKEGKPPSVVYTTKQEFKMIASKNEALLMRSVGIKKEKFGSYYHQWVHEAESKYLKESEEILHHTLFLPLLNEAGITLNPQLHMYYTITSDWKELNKDLEFIIPQCPTVTLQIQKK